MKLFDETWKPLWEIDSLSNMFGYVTSGNIDDIVRGIYWINGYTEGLGGTVPFTKVHYIFFATSNASKSSRMQCAIDAVSHTIKMRYNPGSGWTEWK